MYAMEKEKKGFGERFRKLFGINKQEEITLPLQDKDIEKINLNWLSQYITEGIQKKFENQRVGSNNFEKVYLPDKRIILNFFMSKTLQKSEDTFDYFNMRFEFLDEKGNKHRLRLLQNRIILFEPLYLDSSGKVKYGVGNIQKAYDKEIGKKFAKAFSMALILDRMIGTGLRDKVLEEISNIIQKNTSRKISSTEKFKLITILINCFDKIDMQYRAVKNSLEKSDRKKRKKFYEKSFIERIKFKGIVNSNIQYKGETLKDTDKNRENNHTSHESR